MHFDAITGIENCSAREYSNLALPLAAAAAVVVTIVRQLNRDETLRGG